MQPEHNPGYARASTSARLDVSGVRHAAAHYATAASATRHTHATEAAKQRVMKESYTLRPPDFVGQLSATNRMYLPDSCTNIQGAAVTQNENELAKCLRSHKQEIEQSPYDEV